jgi:hypothetical protein
MELMNILPKHIYKKICADVKFGHLHSFSSRCVFVQFSVEFVKVVLVHRAVWFVKL